MTDKVITDLSDGYVMTDDLAVGLLTTQYTVTLYDADEQALSALLFLG